MTLIERGVVDLHALDAANDFYHLPMQSLSQGLERLLKLTYALATLNQSGVLPTRRTIKRYSHDLVRITDDLVHLVSAESEYTSRPAVQDDLQFIQTDTDLRRVLRLLSAFGESSRYYRLEEFLDPSTVDPEQDPDHAWAAMEMGIVTRTPELSARLGAPAEQDALYRAISTEIARTIERFGRAIARMWTLGALGEEAKPNLGVIKSLLFLPDDRLGQPPSTRQR